MTPQMEPKDRVEVRAIDLAEGYYRSNAGLRE